MNTYNTQKQKLIIREYGRNTQNMIAYAKTIEDKKERQAYIETIIKLIISMYPDTRNVEDYRLKVWSHVLQMADYGLDVDIPDNIPATKERKIPERLAYPNLTRRYRHYGQHVRSMIAKARKMEDKEKQTEYIAIIGAYMKMSYKEHNRESVNDEVIFKEFKAMTHDELEIPAGTNLDMLVKQRRRSNSPSNSYSTKKDRHSRHNSKTTNKHKGKPSNRSNSNSRSRRK